MGSSSSSSVLFLLLLLLSSCLGVDSNNQDVVADVPPWLKVYKNGTVERLVGTETVPAGYDPQTKVSSEDVETIPKTGLLARRYSPNLTSTSHPKLRLVLYFHGGAFCTSSVRDPTYHNFLNRLAAEAHVNILSVNYRLAPEHPLPTAHEDSWGALKWVALHASGEGTNSWMKDSVDFSQGVFLAGDSAGANIAHHIAVRAGHETLGLKLAGIALMHPYFWGKIPLEAEAANPGGRAYVDKWWQFLCPSNKGADDPLINPLALGSPPLAALASDHVLVCTAGADILRDRGRVYYESLVKSGWRGKAEKFETEGEGHVFFLLDPQSKKTSEFLRKVIAFLHLKTRHA